MKSTLSWPVRILWFILWFFWQQTITSAKVVRDALLPHASIEPGFVRFATRCRTELEVTVLSSLITLTPGTLTLGAHRPDDGPEWEIVVHGMYFPEPDDLTESLRDMETHMLRAIRREVTDR
ncbi:Na+/H+ antiporter subunit E [Dietzia maris]|jgi:multicomponent Na+:H+ antiporter subunit E|uniref:Na+/H+ antiporter subunit E n=1 Tax=Dietzia maris TaxID=37915 RepID=UPI00104505E6|nr:Na+/H+ antiporter subunit E [Dietzia maris]MCT1434297.1 Na+/H+ antiporter subunit E [Dietzia maris]MCT1521266.1 Na+/H+ antiporter subunit E [Dietzia maris]